ncbi:MAG: hypothetical protein U0073_00075 [Bacteroidia bacterium]
MKTNLILVLSAIFSGILTVYLLNIIVNLRIKNKIGDSDNPIALHILKAILFSVAGILLQEIATPFHTLIKVLPSTTNGADLLVQQIMYYSMFLGIVVLLIFLIIWFSALVFTVTSKGKSIFIEAANNSLGLVIYFAGVVFALSFAVKSNIVPLLDVFIPYPTMPIFH